MDFEQLPVVTNASMNFIKPGSWPESEKPYEILYTPTNGFPTLNYSLEVHDIPIYDLRSKKGQLSLDREGYIVADLPRRLSSEDFWDENKLRSIYSEEVRTYLLSLLGARACYIHECVVSSVCFNGGSQNSSKLRITREEHDSHSYE